MPELKFNQNKVQTLIRKVFPKSSVKCHERFSEGLVNPTFRVRISNPSKTLVVKLGRLKRKSTIKKNNLILNYLSERGIPAPKVYYDGVFDRKFITIMDLAPGENGTSVYKNASQKMKRKILLNSGKALRNIHNLRVPDFWVHQNHEIKNDKEWKSWTKLRIEKYLKFFRKKFEDIYPFLEKCEP